MRIAILDWIAKAFGIQLHFNGLPIGVRGNMEETDSS
jgi:hypothetical protein